MGGQSGGMTPQIGTSPMGNMNPTGNMPAFSPQMGNSQALQGLFGGYSGYQAPQMPQGQIPQVTQPIYPTAALTPQQAAAATQASILARTPLAAPRGAPRNSPFEAYNQQVRQQNLGLTGRGNK